MQGEDLDFKDISCEIGERTKSSWHEAQKNTSPNSEVVMRSTNCYFSLKVEISY